MSAALAKRVMAAVQALELASPTNEITARALWTAVKAHGKEHPLYDQFEWNDSKAADRYRDEQAGRLLRLSITVEHEERIIRAPICVRSPDAGPNEPGYVRTLSIVDDVGKSRQVLHAELDRVMRIVERARGVASAANLSDEYEELLASLLRLKERVAA